MLKIILGNLFLLSSFIVCGQDTTYFDSNWNNVKSLNKAEYYKIVIHNENDTNKVIEKNYFKNGQIRLQKHYSVYKDYILDGSVKEWFKNGKLRKSIDYADGKLNGQLLTYWDNGNKKRIDKFKNDEFINGKCFNSKGIEIEYYNYEILPEYPGGINKLYEYLGKEIKYPR
jgi:antitoxin component YwqK of YwqJK toxin-antitoxin module